MLLMFKNKSTVCINISMALKPLRYYNLTKAVLKQMCIQFKFHYIVNKSFKN